MNRINGMAIAGALAVAGIAVAPGAATPSQQPAAATQQPATASRREPQFENARAKSWKSIIMPNQPLTQHRHDNARAIIALTDGTLKLVDKDRKVIKTYVWEKGKSYWYEADPPGQTHADLNDGTKPLEVIVVEMQPQKP